jgi:hypothetical protein
MDSDSKVENDFDLKDFVPDVGGGDNDESVKKKKKRIKKKPPNAANPTGLTARAPAPASQGIKMGPLIMLIMMTGTTLLPVMLYAGDWFGNFIQRQHILGSLGHKLNIGASPKKRVRSFYEKHDPYKMDEVDKILAKYYGDYPTLIKRLERKYQDYGYFLNWEKDEAPMTLALEKLTETKKYLQTQFNKHAPQKLKIAARNANYNFGKTYRKLKILWRKQIWPHLEPFFGVPDGAAAQKRKDRASAQSRKGRRKKNTDYDDEM